MHQRLDGLDLPLHWIEPEPVAGDVTVHLDPMRKFVTVARDTGPYGVAIEISERDVLRLGYYGCVDILVQEKLHIARREQRRTRLFAPDRHDRGWPK